MSDPLYHLTKVWACTAETEARYTDVTGGGLNFNSSPNKFTEKWNLPYNGTISGVGVTLTGNKSGLSSGSMNIFGGYNAYDGGGARKFSSRFASGTLEFTLNLTSLPTTDRYLMDTSRHNTNTGAGVGAFSFLVAATTGQVLFQHNASGAQIPTGIFLTSGSDLHIVIQVNDNYDSLSRSDVSFGLNGTMTQMAAIGTFFMSNTITLGHCQSFSPHPTEHGLIGIIKNIRYTHLKNRYPVAGAYSVPGAYDLVAPTALAITATTPSYSGLPAVEQAGNAQPVDIYNELEVTSVTGGTGSYTYRWYDFYRGVYEPSAAAYNVRIGGCRWYSPYAFMCVVTDSGGVVGVTTRSAVLITQDPTDTAGIFWVPDVPLVVGQPAVFTATLYGFGGDYDDIPQDADINVNWVWTVFSGSLTGADTGVSFISDPVSVEDAGSVVRGIAIVAAGGDFDKTTNYGYGTLFQSLFWQDFIRTEETVT